MSNSTSAVGRVLMIGAGVLVVITIVWLLVAGTTAGGRVLCLGLAAPVFLVMIAGGLYLNRQGAAQQAEQKSLEQQWAWRDDERRARLYVAERLEQAGARLAASGKAPAPFVAELRGLADRLRRPGYEQGVPPTISADAYQALKSLDASLMAEADKDHLHHRLMRLGHGHRRSVVILWLWSGLLSVFVLYPVYTGKGNAIVPVGIAALALVLLTFFHPGIRRDRARAASSADPSEA